MSVEGPLEFVVAVRVSEVERDSTQVLDGGFIGSFWQAELDGQVVTETSAPVHALLILDV